MKSIFFWLLAFLAALGSEVLTSLWLWRSAPTDTIRVWYSGFGSYLMERLPAWIVIFGVLVSIAALLGRKVLMTR